MLCVHQPEIGKKFCTDFPLSQKRASSNLRQVIYRFFTYIQVLIYPTWVPEWSLGQLFLTQYRKSNTPNIIELNSVGNWLVWRAFSQKWVQNTTVLGLYLQFNQSFHFFWSSKMCTRAVSMIINNNNYQIGCILWSMAWKCQKIDVNYLTFWTKNVKFFFKFWQFWMIIMIY